MAFIVTLILCAAAHSGCAAAHAGASALGPASSAPSAALQEPEEGGGPPSAPFEAPPLCPEPLISEPRWAQLDLTSEGRVVFSEPALEPLAQVLSEDFAAVTGLKLAVAGIPARSGDIVLSLGYMPDTVRENPEAFFIEVFDHVLIAGQTLDGAARATARFLQLVQPPKAAPGEGEDADPSARAATSPRIAVPPLRIVDAPSIRWRVLEVTARQLLAAEEDAAGADKRYAALAHLAGFNALCIVDPDFLGLPPERRALEARLDAAALRRGIAVVDGPRLRGGPALKRLDIYAELTPALDWNWAERAAALEAEDALEFLPTSPFRSRIPPDALGPDAATTLARIPRLLHPIGPVGRAAEAPALLGTLFGHATGLERAAYLPVAWWAPVADAGHTAALAGEAWHGGMRVDSLRGAPELARVLAAVDAALRRAK